MWHSLFFILVLLGCGLIYLSHKNQTILSLPLNKAPWRSVAYSCLGLALALELTMFSTSSAIALWLAMLMFFLGMLPFLSLLKSKD